MDFLNSVVTGKGSAYVAIALITLTAVVAILGFIDSKSKRGQKLHEKIDAYKSMAVLAYTEASKQDGLTGKERKNFAIDFAEKEMENLGYKKVSIPLISSAIEATYAQLSEVYDKAYNWGLSTNTDGSQYKADVNLDGIPDYLEKGEVANSDVATTSNKDNKEAVVSIPSTSTTTTTTTTIKDIGLHPVSLANESSIVVADEQPQEAK